MDDGIENDLSHEYPEMDMKDREESVARGSGDVYEVYSGECSAPLEVTNELRNSQRACWEDNETREW